MSKTKAIRAEYEAAEKEFRAADANAKRLLDRIDDIGARLLQARLESSRIETEIDRFAIGEESADTIAKKAAELARNLGGRKAETEATIAVLDRAHTAVSTELAAAKVKVLHAEAKALQVARRYYDEAVSELADEFIRTNRDRLLRLLQLSNAYGIVYGWKPYRSSSDGFYGIRSLDNLFDTLLTEAAERVSKSDGAFEGVLGTIEKGDPPTTPLCSDVISSAERGRVNELSYRGLGEAELLDAVSQDDSPPPPQPMSSNERDRLSSALYGHESLIERCRNAIRYAEDRLRELKKEDMQGGFERQVQDLKDEIETKKRTIAESERAAASLRETLSTDHALRSASMT